MPNLGIASQAGTHLATLPKREGRGQPQGGGGSDVGLLGRRIKGQLGVECTPDAKSKFGFAYAEYLITTQSTQSIFLERSVRGCNVNHL